MIAGLFFMSVRAALARWLSPAWRRAQAKRRFERGLRARGYSKRQAERLTKEHFDD